MRLCTFFFLFSFVVFASEEQFKIAGNYYAFIEKDTLLVSENCKKKCVALKKSKSITSKVIPKKKKFVSSLGSYACTEILGGKSLLGVKKNKDMIAVCLFKKDLSMVSLNSLTTYIENLSEQ